MLRRDQIKFALKKVSPPNKSTTRVESTDPKAAIKTPSYQLALISVDDTFPSTHIVPSASMNHQNPPFQLSLIQRSRTEITAQAQNLKMKSPLLHTGMQLK